MSCFRDEYIKRKEALSKAQRAYEQCIAPREEELAKIQDYYDQLFPNNRSPRRAERDAFIACMMLLYAPLALLEGKQSRNKLKRTLASTLEVSPPIISKWVVEVRLRYANNHEGIQDKAEQMYSVLTR